MEEDTDDPRIMALSIIRDQIRLQFDSQRSLENKASWLLGFLAVLFTVFYSTQTSKVSHAVLVAIGVLLLISVSIVIISLFGIGIMWMSPGPASFKEFIENNVNDPGVLTSLAQKLSEDNVADFEHNKRILYIRSALLNAGYILLLAALIVMFIKLV